MASAPMRMPVKEIATRAPAVRPRSGRPLRAEEPEHEEEEPQPKGRSVPPPPNAFSEAEALRWPAIARPCPTRRDLV